MMGRLVVLATIAACARNPLRPPDAGDDTGPRCGDGIVDPGEICDDGNNADTDGCSADCKSDETCGNGIVDVAVGERCDDGNNLSGDGCSDDCQSDETCGNGVLDMAKGETCDDGNNVSGDGCSANCQSNESCGNGILDPGETCDPGGNVFTSTCDPDCTKPVCGDGVVNMPAGEKCDDHNTVDTDGCTHLCKLNVCGDGFLFIGKEQCDDGNTNNNDGCRNDCTLGPGNDFKQGAFTLNPGTITGTLLNAKDDIIPSCAVAGGRDVFYQFAIGGDEVVYFDSFGTNFDSVIAIYSGACAVHGGELACNDDASCGTVESQLAVQLDAGTYCLVVDESVANETNHSFTVTFHEGGGTGEQADFDSNGQGSVSDDLNNHSPDTTGGCATSDGPDHGYFFTTCPGSTLVSASTCGSTSDTVLYLRSPSMFDGDLDCNDDDPMCAPASSVSATIDGADLVWIIVDTADSTTAGPYTLTYSVQ